MSDGRIPMKFLHSMERQRPLCPDHRDKAKGYPCLLCEIERLSADNENLRRQILSLEGWYDCPPVEGDLP